MNKKQLVDRVATATGHSSGQTRETLEAILNEIQQELVSGGKVSLTDFGVFSLDYSGSGDGHNPRTGESFHIYRAKPVFRAGKLLRESVSEAMALKNALSIEKARTPG
jgi:DNA-binding protein HU-beta